ncbi:hypothetical protein [Sphingomonas bacterium]|uniref:hypothetical protein n=1 Tax=Sphingomonas bacterium TaxID=1895847 RepID=UPI001576A140|nr:hypothetical protein [Sphingomonas bacterium]
MIFIAALLSLVTSTGPAPAKSAAEAMAHAVPLGCLLHVSGASPIIQSRQKELAAAGLEYFGTPPADIAQAVARGMPATWGKPQFAKVMWAGGAAWVVGFEKGQCFIDASSDDGPALLKALHDQFETPGVPWRKLPPAAAPERYAMAVQPPGKPAIAIVANLVGMDLAPGGRREIVNFESTPNK